MRHFVVVLLLAGLCYVKPVCGEEGDQQGWLTPRRAWGIALFSGSTVLLKKSWDFHQQANETYALYRKAATGPQAELLYESAISGLSRICDDYPVCRVLFRTHSLESDP